MEEISLCDIATDMSKVDFSQVPENSGQTVRRSLDNTLFIIKWGPEPTFITTGIITPSKIMTHQEALAEMQTPEWSEPLPPE